MSEQTKCPHDEDYCSKCGLEMDTLEEQRSQLESLLTEYAEVVERYGQHESGCASRKTIYGWQTPENRHPKCTCGLDQTLAALKAKREQLK